MDDDPCKEEESPPEISTDPGDTRDTRRDVKAEEEEDGHVRIGADAEDPDAMGEQFREEEIPPKISTGKTQRNVPLSSEVKHKTAVLQKKS
ncbi:unnamed protein product [Staurois parvus]|uniref:Uncharacterized protein n=1 Tax=Staurois parvus TaxID=386267 RepID=A0ABN9EHP3_9NEOB|nr:unnamed protein product [Staurois parvus]